MLEGSYRPQPVLALIRQYLRAGILANGEHIGREQGAPQGAPASPLLANVKLDGLLCTRLRVPRRRQCRNPSRINRELEPWGQMTRWPGA
ncbi:MAG: hypothetical protein IPJ08_05130 [Burkholderiales bacterium]|nr:hypothetical protein [Burkholderiales bacterium]